MGVGKKIVKYSLSVLLVALLVMRADIRDFINDPDISKPLSLVEDVREYFESAFKSLTQSNESPTDHISLTKNSLPAQPDSDNTDNTLKSDDNMLNSETESINKIAVTEVEVDIAAIEMENVRIIAAQKFARFMADMESSRDEEPDQDQDFTATKQSRIRNDPAKERQKSPNKPSPTVVAVVMPKQKTVQRTKVSKPAQSKSAKIKPIPVVTPKTTTIASLNINSQHQKILKQNSVTSNNRKTPKDNLFADDTVVIIVNSKNLQKITIADIKNLYTDRMTSWRGGQNITVYNLPVNSPTREIFSQKLLRQSPSHAAAAASNRIIKNEIRNSTETKTARLVAAKVSRNPNAIGYTTYKNVKGREKLRIIMAVQ